LNILGKKMRLTYNSPSALFTQNFGAVLGKVLKDRDLVALAGELGAGKTELVKGIARGLECSPNSLVASPTYILLREYEGRIRLYHFDFYRINSVRELEDIGYEEYFEQNGVCVVEWADKFAKIFPLSTLWIKLYVTGENERMLEIESNSPEKWEKRLKSAIEEIRKISLDERELEF